MNTVKKFQRNTWYGLNATVIIGPGFMHTAGWGVFLIPHPPVANWLLRRGLSEKNREALTLIHEFQHLQSVPFIILFAALLFVLAFSMTQAGLTEIIFILIGSHATWEIGTEILTYLDGSQFYRSCYEKVSPFPRITFWFIAITISIISLLIILL